MTRDCGAESGVVDSGHEGSIAAATLVAKSCSKRNESEAQGARVKFDVFSEAQQERGVDRMMCSVQIGDLSRDTILTGMRSLAKHLIPHFDR